MARLYAGAGSGEYLGEGLDHFLLESLEVALEFLHLCLKLGYFLRKVRILLLTSLMVSTLRTAVVSSAHMWALALRHLTVLL